MTTRTKRSALHLILGLGLLTAGCGSRKAPAQAVSAKPDPAPVDGELDTGTASGGRVFSGDLPMGETAPELGRYRGLGEDRGMSEADDAEVRGMAGGGGEVGLAPEVLALFDDIRYEFDSYMLSLPARQQLAALGAYLLDHGGVSLLIEGHCDDRGDAAYNLALGEKRAQTVREFLAGMKVPAARLTTVSYGEERPAVRGATEEAWAANRRVHFRVRWR